MMNSSNGFLSSASGQKAEKLQEAVRLVLNSWPSYQFAVANQLGGSQTQAKDLWFCEELCQHLAKHADLYPDELSDWMGDILDTEFNTISDDGTLDPTAKLLIQLSNWTLGRSKDSEEEAGKRLEEHLQRLRGINNKQSQVSLPQKLEETSSESDNDESDSGEEV